MTKQELINRLKGHQEQAKQALAMHYRFDGAAQEVAHQIKELEASEKKQAETPAKAP